MIHCDQWGVKPMHEREADKEDFKKSSQCKII